MKNVLALALLSTVLFTSMTPTVAYSQDMLDPLNPLSPVSPLNPIWDDDDEPARRPAAPAKPMTEGEKIAFVVSIVAGIGIVLIVMFGPEILNRIRRRQ